MQIYKDSLYNKQGLLVRAKKLVVETPCTHSISVIVFGKKFNSIGAAAREYETSVSTVRSQLNDPTNSNWCYESVGRRAASDVARAVLVDGKVYLSVSLTAAEQGISEKTVRQYIQVKSNWRYLDTLTPEERAKIEDPHLQLASVSSFSMGKGVKVGNEIFPSIFKTAAHFSIAPRTVKKRIRSSTFPDWSWATE
jgi:hypothetical protein